MAKKIFKPRQHESGSAVTTKTHFGSTDDMIFDHSQHQIIDANEKPIVLGDDEIVCKDDNGFYITKKTRVNSGLADPNRYDNRASRIIVKEIKEAVDNATAAV